MFARSILPLFGAVLAALLLAAPALAQMDFDGAVVSADNGHLVLSVNDEQKTFVVNEDTKITLDGQEATLADILVGYSAKVSAELDGEDWVAASIDARSTN